MDNKSFGAFMAQMRKEHNYSQDTIAQRLGYKNRSSVTRLEKGETSWKLEDIFDLAYFYAYEDLEHLPSATSNLFRHYEKWHLTNWE